MIDPAAGERHFRHLIMEFVEHYHRERNHQGLDNRLIAGHTGREVEHYGRFHVQMESPLLTPPGGGRRIVANRTAI